MCSNEMLNIKSTFEIPYNVQIEGAVMKNRKQSTLEQLILLQIEDNILLFLATE